MTRGRYKTPDDNELTGIIRDLTRRIEDLERGAGIGNTSIDAGDLSIGAGSFRVGTVPTVFFGQTVMGSDVVPTWEFSRNNGAIAFQLNGDSVNDQYWALYDGKGNIVVGDDYAATQGLARPYLPITFVEHSNTVPTITTTSASFTSLLTGRFHKQHPYTLVEVLCRASDGTTSGEVQLRNGTTSEVIFGPVAITLGDYSLKTLGPAEIDGDHLSTIEIEVQARRTAGAGTIGVRVMTAYGVETP